MTHGNDGVSRRQLFIGAGALGAAALVGKAAGGSVARAGVPPGTQAPGYDLVPLFNNSAFNLQLSFCLGGASSQTSEVGEVMRIVQQVNKKTGNPTDDTATTADFETLIQECLDMGDRLEKVAVSSGSHRITYRDRMMRASSYAAQALFLVLGGTEPDNEAEYFRICQRRWQKAARRFERPVEEFSVASPYGEIPCYFFPGSGGSRRPTLIISQGSDGQLVEAMSFGVTAGLARGYNIVLFEGPGQMSLLFEDEITFTPDWDRVVGPILEAVRRRNDVGRVGLIGISFAGALCARAAADLDFDATVLTPAGWNTTLSWADQKTMNTVKQTHKLPAPEKAKVVAEVNEGFAKEWAEMPPTLRFDVYKRGEIMSRSVLREARAGRPVSNYYGLLEKSLPYVFDRDYRRMTRPILLLRNQGDLFFNGGGGNPPSPTTGKYDQPRYAFSLLDKVPQKRKKFVNLTASQGASLHCQPLAPQFASEIIFDWLDRNLFR